MIERVAAPRTAEDEGQEVFLRNDSPGIRIVHDIAGKAQSYNPGEARAAVLPKAVIEILEDDYDIELAKGNVLILHIVTEAEAQKTAEGKGPRPSVRRSTEGNAAAELADNAADMDWSNFRDQARATLGDDYPPGTPSRDDIVAALRQKASESSGEA